MDIITGLILAAICLIVGFLAANLVQGLRHSPRDNPIQDENENRTENLVEEARIRPVMISIPSS